MFFFSSQRFYLRFDCVSSFKMANKYLENVGNVDVISDAEVCFYIICMKVFCVAYYENTLVIKGIFWQYYLKYFLSITSEFPL